MEPTYYLPATSEVVRGTYAGFDVVAAHLALIPAAPDGEAIDIVILLDAEDAQAVGHDLIEQSLNVTPLQDQPGIVEPEATSEEDTGA